MINKHEVSTWAKNRIMELEQREEYGPVTALKELIAKSGRQTSEKQLWQSGPSAMIEVNTASCGDTLEKSPNSA